MSTNYAKLVVMVVWALLVGLSAYYAGVVSLAGWTVIAVLACGPLLFLLRLWNVPAESMSESIQGSLRRR